ncbi:MAG TPA: prepilin-type N-terminal cleavage/methylation domain-containing protein [Myxococcota bacterium]|nr:prepilin-type N-terminal cleavage/methylation domain-containing protein [Myxococcota bacterium]
MQTFREQAGWTLIELMTAVAIVGFMSVMGIGALRSYSLHEDTRKAAVSVAGQLATARSQAISLGKMTFVAFGPTPDGTVPAFAAGQWGALVIDQNADGTISPGDSVLPLNLPAGTNSQVSIYGAQGETELKTTPIPTLDESTAVVNGDMTALVAGTTAPVDPTFGIPIIAFSTQGAPVTIAAPANFGGGAGGVYLTDNGELLFGIVVQPLGDVHTLMWDTAAGGWK